MIYMHNKHDSPWTGNHIINQCRWFSKAIWLVEVSGKVTAPRIVLLKDFV